MLLKRSLKNFNSFRCKPKLGVAELVLPELCHAKTKCYSTVNNGDQVNSFEIKCIGKS